MNKESLIHQVFDVLEHAGFITSKRCNIRPRSFDLAARRERILLLLKVLANIDGLNDETARELKQLAFYLLGHPLVVGEKARDHYLETGVVYNRHGIPSINISTLYNHFVENIPPLVYAGPGGLYVNLDGKKLQHARNLKKMSIGDLASKIGVSRRAISMYEEEEMDASVDNALKLEDILDTTLVNPIDILKQKNIYSETLYKETYEELKIQEHSIFMRLTSLGFKVFPTTQAPFNAVSQEKDDKETTILTGVSKYSNTMIKRARLMSSISVVTHTHSVFIIEGKSKSEQIDSTVLIEKTELKKMEDSEDFIDLIQSYSNK
ncbi:MAG TPA: transcriptional regulator [Methanosarcinales archaeon]|nr:transcriptional regulator [Methanosarcinales archaeon]